MLEEDINRSIGNAWFRSKIQDSVKERKGYKDSIFVQAKQIVKEFENQVNPLWTVQDIEKRTKAEAKKITDFIFE
ncbi:HNH endonuclease family protein [Anaerococcus murdochii]|uniref:HNH endonuclease family protein n=1 Tax=Anaerococcus murdochii TaxID=411577 RepID=A0ABS7SZS8_9FIRM|nr:DUF1524 domain-containing protein [Anaerococcus murdochii]MBZ2387007.1 HNH endonuclease family protein [Anaerococcus murdochii]